MSDRKKEFSKLSKKAAQCRLCPAMADLPAILRSKNGSIHTNLIFIGEAPGRFGAGRTGVPFHGDRSGDNFELLLDHAGLARKDIFITNAVLCNPLKDGNNRRPTSKEISSCSSFLQDLLDIVAPKVVSTIGGVGLAAVNRLLGTHYKLADVVARPLSVSQFTLFPLYHPSPRVIYTRRSLDQQKKDFKKLMKTLASAKP
jgi:DNA polymerase